MKMLRSAARVVVAIAAGLLGGCGSNRPYPGVASRDFNVRDFGAAGDGRTLDTAAVQRALDAAVAAGGGEVVVPAGTFVIGSVRLGSYTTLRLEAGATLLGSSDAADYPLASVHYEGEAVAGHLALIHAEDADRVGIVGPGTIAGSEPLGDLRSPRGPVMVEFTRCRDVRLDGFRDRYRHLWSIHLLYCSNVVARGLDIRTSLTNGDGIDVESTTDVLIDRCTMDTGDDCVALKSGRGLRAARRARPTAHVTVSNCTLGSGFAPIALGTEMSGGIRDVHVQHCTFTRGANAIFIKSRLGRGGYIRDVFVDDVTSTGTTTFLGIDLIRRGIVGTDPVPGDDGVPGVGNVRVTRATVDCGTLVDGSRVPEQRPLDGLWLSDLHGSADHGISLANVVNAHVQNVDVAVAEGPLLSTHDVTGTGLQDAVEAGPPDLGPVHDPVK